MSLTTDLRLVFRQSVQAPRSVALIVITLAFGIGLTTAAFSVVHGAVLRPLAYHEPDRLVAVQADFLRLKMTGMSLAGPEVAELMQFDAGFSRVGAYGFRGGATVQTRHESVQASAGYVTASLLETLGVAPALGRAFQQGDGENGPADGVILAHDFWASGFDRDPAIVGQTLRINGVSRPILGVMPPRFDLLDAEVDLLLPLSVKELASGGRTNHSYTVIARLAPGLSLDGVRQRVTDVVRTWTTVIPSSHAPNLEMHPLRIVPLHEVLTGTSQALLLTLLGAVSLVLLIACVNVANLVLARAERARHQTAIHVALGAPRGVLFRRWILEGLSWSTAGGLLGCLLASALVSVVVSLQPAGVPRLSEIALDWTAVAFALSVTTVTGLIFGVVPGLRLTAVQPARVLGDATRGEAGSVGRQWLRHSLVVSELAFAIVLLAGASVMTRSFLKVASVDPGFSTENVWRMQASFPARLFPTAARVESAAADLASRLDAHPDIVEAAVMSGLPPRREPNRSTYQIEGQAFDTQGAAPLIDFVQICTPGFFDVLRLKPVEGRTLSAADTASSVPVVVVNETLANRYWPGRSAVGERLRAGGPQGQERPWLTVVGVVKDIRQAGLQAAPGSELFVPLAQAEAGAFLPRSLNVIVRAAPGARDVAGILRTELRTVAPESPAQGLRTMDEVVSRSVAQPRFLTTVLGSFAVGALVLAAIGIYSVISYLVSMRTREMGVRLALGASPGGVRRLVLRQTYPLLAIGLGIGLVATQWTSRLLASVAGDLPPADLVSTAAAVVLLTGCALLAADAPARRAARVDPLEALRGEQL